MNSIHQGRILGGFGGLPPPPVTKGAPKTKKKERKGEEKERKKEGKNDIKKEKDNQHEE